MNQPITSDLRLLKCFLTAPRKNWRLELSVDMCKSKKYCGNFIKIWRSFEVSSKNIVTFISRDAYYKKHSPEFPGAVVQEMALSSSSY
jgi:hypothetical protein